MLLEVLSVGYWLGRGMPGALYKSGMICGLVTLSVALAIILGGMWIWVAIAVFAVATPFFDVLLERPKPYRSHSLNSAANPATAWHTRLCYALGLAHFAVLIIGLWAVSQTPFVDWQSLALIGLMALYFGQLSNAVAHELIHSPQRAAFHLGKWIYISLLIGHHTSAHRLIHHRFVATPKDPNSCQEEISFYRFFARAWPQSYQQGRRAESARNHVKLHPYTLYAYGHLAFLLSAFVAFGPSLFVVYLAVAVMAQVQLFLADYVQHYGLARRETAPGKYEPVGPAHAWDAPRGWSSPLLLGATFHAAHHQHPGEAFDALHPAHQSPKLPLSLPVMSAVALFPRLWFALMTPRLARYQRQAQAQTSRKEAA
ncbi:MAG: alkane 1-monooxygenase [Pseudomonadota bacterium]